MFNKLTLSILVIGLLAVSKNSCGSFFDSSAKNFNNQIEFLKKRFDTLKSNPNLSKYSSLGDDLNKLLIISQGLLAEEQAGTSSKIIKDKIDSLKKALDLIKDPIYSAYNQKEVSTSLLPNNIVRMYVNQVKETVNKYAKANEQGLLFKDYNDLLARTRKQVGENLQDVGINRDISGIIADYHS